MAVPWQRAAALGLAALLPVAGQAQGYAGAWCGHGDAPFMAIDDHGVGFGDHLVCDWDVPFPDDGSAWVVELTCRAVHVLAINDDGTIETVEEPRPPMVVGFYLAGDDVIVSASMSEEGPVMSGFDRCD